jgi:hypothetical protein
LPNGHEIVSENKNQKQKNISLDRKKRHAQPASVPKMIANNYRISYVFIRQTGGGSYFL